jgi:hypothetical protein
VIPVEESELASESESVFEVPIERREGKDFSADAEASRPLKSFI